MATFNMNDADNYGNNGSGSFFSLKDDKDTAKVRFLYNSISDIEGHAVHQVEFADGKKRYVNCLRAYNDPIEKCPFCEAQMKIFPKLFLKLYNEDAGECQIWERGKSYFQRMASLTSRYNPLVNELVEIERSGKKGDMQTTYEFYPIDNSPVNLDDYECPEPLGTTILDKTADDMREYLQTGNFSSEDSSNNSNTENSADTSQRRTPNRRQAF